MQKLEKHIDGEWWTSNHVYNGHGLQIKMKDGNGSKIHIWNLEGSKVIKTFRYNFAKDEFLISKAIKWINQKEAVQVATE